MATAEMLFPDDQSRGDLLFARRRRSHSRPSPKPRPESSFTPPQPPDRGRFRFTRGQIIAGGTVIAGSVIAVFLQPWQLLTVQPEQTEPETLESLVAQAKKMEDEYKGQDLSDKVTREKYMDVLAGIFAFHNHDFLSRQQFKQAVNFEDNLIRFVQQRIDSGGKLGTPTPQQLENERETTASTDNRKKKITINVSADGFKQVNLSRVKNIPTGWNPLKELRLVLLHEFNHLVIESSDPVIFSIIDPNDIQRDKRIEGFRLMGIDQRGNFAAVFDDLHEAVIELLARNISQSDFGSYFSNRDTSITREEITTLISRLETVLQVAGITHQELSKLHKASNLREFLLILANNAGVTPETPIENRIRFGSIIAGAIERNDQRILQNYINQVIRARQS